MEKGNGVNEKSPETATMTLSHHGCIANRVSEAFSSFQCTAMVYEYFFARRQSLIILGDAECFGLLTLCLVLNCNQSFWPNDDNLNSRLSGVEVHFGPRHCGQCFSFCTYALVYFARRRSLIVFFFFFEKNKKGLNSSVACPSCIE